MIFAEKFTKQRKQNIQIIKRVWRMKGEETKLKMKFVLTIWEEMKLSILTSFQTHSIEQAITFKSGIDESSVVWVIFA